MAERFLFGWRIVATGFCFAVFGVGSLILCGLYFPVIRMFVRDKKERIDLARATIQSAFQCFISLMQALCVLRYEVEQRQRLDRKGLLVIANHPSLIDTVFLMALLKQANCVLKTELQSNPFTRGVVRAAGYIVNNQGAGLIADCVDTLQQGCNLIIFPEGTRSPQNGQLVFKRGAANIAVRARRDLTPVVIRCQPRTLGKGAKWWHIPVSIARFRIEVCDDIPVGPFIEGAVSEVKAVRELSAFLQAYFIEKVQGHAYTGSKNSDY